MLAAMLPEGTEGSISTVPGAFKPNGRSETSVASMVSNLLLAVSDLVEDRADHQHAGLAEAVDQPSLHR